MHLDRIVPAILLAACVGTARAPETGAPAVRPASSATPSSAAPEPRASQQDAGASPDATVGEAAPDPLAALLVLDATASTSVGAPGRGQLLGGAALPDVGPGFARNPRRPEAARFASVELAQAIVRAAAIVEAELPGSGLVVHDLSLEGGGPIAQHGSHQNGRDADLLFYALDANGAPMRAVGVPLDPTGAGWDFKDLAVPEDDARVKLDARRTWRFLQALFEVAGDHVQRIFVVEHVRALLLAEAAARRAPASIVERFSLVTCQPETPHDDHMHVRFFCAPDDIPAGCEDTAPWYPWRRDALASLGIEPVLAKRATREARNATAERTTSAEEARARAEARAPLHRDVQRFLAERKAWMPQPHPGRPYCR